MARGEKLFLSQTILLWRHLYLLPDGVRAKSCCPRCEGSGVISLSLLRHYMQWCLLSRVRGMCWACYWPLSVIYFCHSEVGLPSCSTSGLSWCCCSRRPLTVSSPDGSVLGKWSLWCIFYHCQCVAVQSSAVCPNEAEGGLIVPSAQILFVFHEVDHISWVLLVLSSKLCSQHQPSSLLALFLYTVSSPSADEADDHGVTCKFVDGFGQGGWICSHVHREIGRGLSTQHWGEPLLKGQGGRADEEANIDCWRMVSLEVLDPVGDK